MFISKGNLLFLKTRPHNQGHEATNQVAFSSFFIASLKAACAFVVAASKAERDTLSADRSPRVLLASFTFSSFAPPFCAMLK